MSANFPNREKLEAMSIEQIKATRIEDQADEALVQDVLNKRRVNIPILDMVNKKDVPDIKTPEDEAKWQKIIDERQDKVDKQWKGEAYLEKKVEKLEAEKAKLEPTKKVYCDECGTHSPAFHKKGCSKRKK
jgi:hypothetical protein